MKTIEEKLRETEIEYRNCVGIGSKAFLEGKISAYKEMLENEKIFNAIKKHLKLSYCYEVENGIATKRHEEIVLEINDEDEDFEIIKGVL